MSIPYNTEESVLHNIRVKLYKSYLGDKNTYFARTASEAILSVEQTCAAMRDRGGFTGDYHSIVEHIKRYNNEVAYQLCDGFAVSNGWYVIYPNVGGTFKTPNENADPKSNPLTFRFRALSALRKLAAHIAVTVEGLADVEGYIDEFLHHEDGGHVDSNTWYMAGGLFTLRGDKIKIDGDDPGTGMFFVDADNPGSAVKATNLNQNDPSTLRGLVPDGTDFLKCRIEVRTQFTGSGSTLLKNPRTIISPFILERA
jgi:hypothetical protein